MLGSSSLDGNGNDKGESNKCSKEEEEEAWKQAFALPVQYMREIQHQRSPASIVQCLRKTSMAIASALKQARGDSSVPGKRDKTRRIRSLVFHYFALLI